MTKRPVLTALMKILPASTAEDLGDVSIAGVLELMVFEHEPVQDVLERWTLGHIRASVLVWLLCELRSCAITKKAGIRALCTVIDEDGSYLDVRGRLT